MGPFILNSLISAGGWTQLWHFPVKDAHCRQLSQRTIRLPATFPFCWMLKESSGCPSIYAGPCPIYACHMLSWNRLHRFLQRTRSGLEEHPVPSVRGLNSSSLRHPCLYKKVAHYSEPPIWWAQIVLFMGVRDRSVAMQEFAEYTFLI